MLTFKEAHSIFEYRDGFLYYKKRVNFKKNIGDKAGALNSQGYLKFGYKKRLYRVHKVIYFMHHGNWGDVIDHIDRDKLNNKIENLRSVTRDQNNVNSGPKHFNTSGYKGVVWSKDARKWFARISIKSKGKHLGFFEKKEDAAIAYDNAVIEYRGGYGYLNFPDRKLNDVDFGRPERSNRQLSKCTY